MLQETYRFFIAVSITVDTIAPSAPSITALSALTNVVLQQLQVVQKLKYGKTYNGSTLLGSATAGNNGAFSITHRHLVMVIIR